MLFLLLMAASSGETGSKACEPCHAAIFRRYAATGMARSSGRIQAGTLFESLRQSAFSDSSSAADYRVSQDQGGFLLEFSRPGSGVAGSRILQWFIGSGNVGRSYLFASNGYLFQSPVSYYSSLEKWDVSPGYQRNRTIDLARAVEPACLQCHTSRLQPVAGTQNRYSDPPFLEGGVSCERCHGPGSAHIAKMASGVKAGSRQIIQPAKLDAARRDSICAQCHLTGAARVARAHGKSDSYRPGALLSDYIAVFVWTDGESSGVNATSHFEKLALSGCKKAAGDRMWCGSCHDPHSEVPVAERAAYYGKRCRTCHASQTCQRGPDCVACHMPQSPTRTTDHLVYTDHSIPRTPGLSKAADGPTLRSFWPSAPSLRDLALAHAVVAPTVPALRPQTLQLLQRAEVQSPQDPAILSQLAQIYDRMGREEQAMALCERLLKIDPDQTAAAVNLGSYYAKHDRLPEAIALWKKALERNPALSSARMNLAVAQHRSGDAAAAVASLRTALEFDPDLEPARRLLAEIDARR